MNFYFFVKTLNCS